MDTSKRFFQLHGVNAAEEVVLRKKLRRKGDGGILPGACADGDRNRSLRLVPSLGAAAADRSATSEAESRLSW